MDTEKEKHVPTHFSDIAIPLEWISIMPREVAIVLRMLQEFWMIRMQDLTTEYYLDYDVIATEGNMTRNEAKDILEFLRSSGIVDFSDGAIINRERLEEYMDECQQGK